MHVDACKGSVLFSPSSWMYAKQVMQNEHNQVIHALLPGPWLFSTFCSTPRLYNRTMKALISVCISDIRCLPDGSLEDVFRMVRTVISIVPEISKMYLVSYIGVNGEGLD